MQWLYCIESHSQNGLKALDIIASSVFSHWQILAVVGKLWRNNMQCVVNETVLQQITVLFDGILTSQYSSFL